MKMLEEIEKAILEETPYEEPLHGIIHGFLKHGVCQDPKDVIDAVLSLLGSRKLNIYYQSGWGGDPYLNITSVPLSDLDEYLRAYIEKHKKEFNQQYKKEFNQQYPEDGGQFYIEAIEATE
jgi:hypothetical protein